jgi:two-component system chemotaxis response regulator CheB
VLHGPPSPFTCPDCGGALWEFKDSELVRYRCHVGHGFTAESLGNGQREMVEDALWSALRALEESIELRKRMANRAKSRNLTAILPGIVREMESLQQRTDALRSLLLATPPDESPMKRKRGRRKSNGQTKR